LTIDSPPRWARLIAGLIVAFAIFQWSAVALGSDRGQAGLIVGALGVAATLAVERFAFGRPLAPAARSLGLGWPHAAGMVTAAAICVLLVLVVPLFVAVTGASLAVTPQWALLLPGLFSQGGIAEEMLFRGYLYGHLRAGRSFWRAAWLATLPFVVVHLLLFFTMPWPIALAALLLSLVLSFPLARLFDCGGATIWPPALIHFVVQGTVKIVEVSGPGSSAFPLVWMAAGAVIPLVAFAIRRPQRLNARPVR
jgi:membrane protease YdiL (CAAX protease family)